MHFLIVTSVFFDIVYNFTDDKLSVGLLTRQKLVKLHNEGDLSNQRSKNIL